MQILFDLFPAHLSISPPGTCALDEYKSFPPVAGAYYVDKTRVIVTSEYVMVARDSDTGPLVIFREGYTLFDKNEKSTDSFVVTDAGKMLAFRRDTNCGCGSRLRGWNPFRIMSSKNDPTE